mgnify:CR=1 FL=1
MSLTPEHLEDLKRSCLTDATIAVCRFESVRPQSFRALPGVESVYRLPYWSIDGTVTNVERWKLFPPLQRPDGKQKYHQPPGSDPALYFPHCAHGARLPEIRSVRSVSPKAKRSQRRCLRTECLPSASQGCGTGGNGSIKEIGS